MRRRVLQAGAVFAVLTLGYADLARGGVTAGPLLLVIAYIAVIPFAIVKW